MGVRRGEYWGLGEGSIGGWERGVLGVGRGEYWGLAEGCIGGWERGVLGVGRGEYWGLGEGSIGGWERGVLGAGSIPVSWVVKVENTSGSQYIKYNALQLHRY